MCSIFIFSSEIKSREILFLGWQQPHTRRLPDTYQQSKYQIFHGLWVLCRVLLWRVIIVEVENLLVGKSAYLKDYKTDFDFHSSWDTKTAASQLMWNRRSPLFIFLLWHMWNHKKIPNTKPKRKIIKRKFFCGKLPFVGVFDFVVKNFDRKRKRKKKMFFFVKKRIE